MWVFVLFFILCIAGCIGMAVSQRISAAFAVAGCEAGLLFAAMTIGSGAYWAKDAWGAAWVWEPRLSGMALMTFFFVSWRLAVAILGHQAAADKKLTSSLIVLGLPSMAFTHLAVRLFGGIHPEGIAHVQSAPYEPWQFAITALGFLMMGTGAMVLRMQKFKRSFIQS